jgi:hypothetical protein
MGGRCARRVVVRDGVVDDEDAIGDANGDALEDPHAVGFELDLALEGIADRFDRLADILLQRLAMAGSRL